MAAAKGQTIEHVQIDADEQNSVNGKQPFEVGQNVWLGCTIDERGHCKFSVKREQTQLKEDRWNGSITQEDVPARILAIYWAEHPLSKMTLPFANVETV